MAISDDVLIQAAATLTHAKLSYHDEQHSKDTAVMVVRMWKALKAELDADAQRENAGRNPFVDLDDDGD